MSNNSGPFISLRPGLFLRPSELHLNVASLPSPYGIGHVRPPTIASINQVSGARELDSTRKTQALSKTA
jgi:hypothetical protein